MRDPTHMEETERWARFVLEHPDQWKALHTRFIDAQFQMHRRFVDQLLKEPDGAAKIKQLYHVTNPSAFSST